MIDRMKALRESGTLVAVVVVLVGIAVSSGRIATGLRSHPLPQVLRGVSGLYGLVDALVLTVLALACVLVSPPTRHAKQLTLAASVLLWLGAVAGLVFLVVSLVGAGENSLSRILESIGGLTDVVLRALMGYGLLLGWRLASAPPAAPDAAVSGAPEETAQEMVGAGGEEARSPAPVWRPDDATGVVWRSAADAAGGAPAGTYGSTSPRSGPPVWDPAADVTRHDREGRHEPEDPPR
ncbi:MAG: hypothetical protein HY829_05150 [Actinobacteria bacterium]|nr:hypothetical protein [Actinomycetota bacterium]